MHEWAQSFSMKESLVPFREDCFNSPPPSPTPLPQIPLLPPGGILIVLASLKKYPFSLATGRGYADEEYRDASTGVYVLRRSSSTFSGVRPTYGAWACSLWKLRRTQLRATL